MPIKSARGLEEKLSFETGSYKTSFSWSTLLLVGILGYFFVSASMKMKAVDEH